GSQRPAKGGPERRLPTAFLANPRDQPGSELDETGRRISVERVDRSPDRRHQRTGDDDDPVGRGPFQCFLRVARLHAGSRARQERPTTLALDEDEADLTKVNDVAYPWSEGFRDSQTQDAQQPEHHAM